MTILYQTPSSEPQPNRPLPPSTAIHNVGFRSVFEHSAIGMVLSDTEGRCLAANQSFCKMVGYSEPELLTETFAEITHPDDLAHNLEFARQLLAGKTQSFNFEKRYIHHRGHIVWVLLTASLVRDARGYPLYVISQVQDTTERKLAEQRLQKSEARTRALLDAVPDLMFQVNRKGVFLDYRQPKQTALYAPPDQFLGKKIEEVLPPEVAERSRQAIEQALVSRATQTFEYQLAAQEVTHYYEARLVACAPDEVLIIVRDITERRRMEAAERDQRIMAEAMRDAAEALNSMLNFDELLDRILTITLRVVPHNLASILLVDEQGIAHVVRTSGYDDHGLAAFVATLSFPVATTGNFRVMAETGQPLIIDEVKNYPGWESVPELEWMHAYLGVPIRIKGRTVGFINLDSAQPGFFTPAHAGRLQAVANQVAVALERARLFEAERRQHEIAEALRDTAAALNSTLDFDEVLDRILTNVGRVVPHDSANFMLVDPRQNLAHVVRDHGYEERGIADWLLTLSLAIDQTAGLRHMIETGQPYIVTDARQQPDWIDFPETSWLRSYAGVPIRIDGQVAGFLNLDAATPNYFTPEQADGLRVFADQAAVAIRNARLFQATRRNVERLTLLHESEVTLAQADSVAALHQEILTAATRLVDAMGSALFLYDDDQHLLIVAVDHLPGHLVGERVKLGQGLNGRAAQLRKMQITADYRTSERRISLTDNLPIAAAVAVPLLWQDRLVGTLGVYDERSRDFDEDDLQLLSLYATLAAAALEQRRAMTEARARETEARLLTTRLAGAQEEERARIAAQLHDAIGHHLVTLQKNTELIRDSLPGGAGLVEALSTNLQLLHDTHQLVRSLAMDLDSKVLADLGLVPAVRQHVDRLSTATRLPIELQITGRDRRLPADVERVAFRGAQQALTNVMRHSRATKISVHMHFSFRRLRLTVEDNGRGFNVSAPHNGTELGLPDLRRQVEALRGNFLLESTPGKGTLVALELPARSVLPVNKQQKRVLIVDDHETTRQGLRQLLDTHEDFVCVGEAGDGASALRQLDINQPNLVLMDVKLPGLSGIETTRQIVKRAPHTQVIIFTGHNDETYLEQALQAGAKGYVLKTDSNQQIVAAMQTFLLGEVYISPAMADAWVRLQTRSTPSNPLDTLTDREMEVLQLVAIGQRNRAIAGKLGISYRTVEVHRRNIIAKLGLKKTAEMIQFAVRHGLVQ